MISHTEGNISEVAKRTELTSNLNQAKQREQKTQVRAPLVFGVALNEIKSPEVTSPYDAYDVQQTG